MISSKFLQLIIGLFVASCSASKFPRRWPNSTTPWLNVNCLDPGYANQDLDVAERWKNTYATEAWNAAVDKWKPELSYNFSHWVANSFGSPANIQCSIIGGDSTCERFPQCLNPAAFDAVQRSFAWLHDYHVGLHEGVNEGLNTMQTHMGTFSSTFALQIIEVKEQSFLPVILDFVAMGLAIMSAFTFNIVLLGLGGLTAVTLGRMKDTITPMLTQSTAAIKDSLKKKSEGNVFNSQNSLEDLLGAMVETWWEVIDLTLERLFDGSGLSIGRLYNLISDGKLFNANIPAQSDVSDMVQQVNYGYLIPIAWTLSNQKILPFVLDVAVACGKPSYFDHLIDGRTCYNGWVYFLLNMVDGDREMPKFEMLPGNQDIQSGTYKIWTKNIVAGSINSFNKNGQKNGWPALDVSKDEVILDLISNGGVENPGFFRIPFCNIYNLLDCRQNFY